MSKKQKVYVYMRVPLSYQTGGIISKKTEYTSSSRSEKMCAMKCYLVNLCNCIHVHNYNANRTLNESESENRRSTYHSRIIEDDFFLLLVDLPFVEARPV